MIDETQMNRLIWGDNLLAMQALLAHGYAGKIDLIYIDPPFNSDANYSFQINVEGKQVNKEASIIERLAYTDTWEGGLDSYLDTLYPRLQLLKRLLSDHGTIYAHFDWHVGHYVKIFLDEIFGRENFRNEIIWKRSSAHSDSSICGNSHDVIFLVTKSNKFTWNTQYQKYEEEYIASHYAKVDENGRKFGDFDLTAKGLQGGGYYYDWKGVYDNWRCPVETMQRYEQEGRVYYTRNGRPRYKRFIDEMPGMPLQDVWTDVPPVNSQAKERLDYPTQKPEALLERIIKASSNEGDLVADFFCGSGTTMAVAEKLNRRWIGCNLDKVGIQVSRNRLVNQGAKPFLLENIGNYQRHMIYLSGSKINEMQRIILKLYGAAPRSDRPDLGSHTPDGQEPELVYVGYPDRPVTAKKVIELAQEAEILDGTGYKTLVVLAWDYDYNFNTELENRKAALRTPLKVNIKPLTIPPEIYNYLNANFSQTIKNQFTSLDIRHFLIHHQLKCMMVNKVSTK
jgi:adenine-specific DNA-methyltransferase